MSDEKLLRALMGACSTAIWSALLGQWTHEQAIGTIHTFLLKVAKEKAIDLSSSTQIERLRDEAVEFTAQSD